MVTPLRDILRRTELRLEAVGAHDPGARTLGLNTHEGGREELRYDQLLIAVARSRARCRSGLGRHAIGVQEPRRCDLAAQYHVIETLETANATEDASRRDALLTYVFVGGGYSGLEALAELQDFAADAIERCRAPACTGCAGSSSRRSTGCCPRSTSTSPRLRGSRAARTRYRHPARRPPRGGGGAVGGTVDRRADRHRDPTGLDGRRRPASLAALELPLDEQGRVEIDEFMAVRGLDGVWAAGDCAAVPDPAKRRAAACPPTAQHAVRQGPVVAHNIAAALGAAGGEAPVQYAAKAAFVNLGRYKAVGKLGRLSVRGFSAWWLARTYHMSQIPGLARKVRAITDWTVGLPFARDCGGGRLYRPSAAAARRRGPMSRRHPSAARLTPANVPESSLGEGARDVRCTWPPQWPDGRRPLHRDRALLRPCEDQARQAGQGQLLLRLADRRRRAPGDRADRGLHVPGRAGRAGRRCRVAARCKLYVQVCRRCGEDLYLPDPSEVRPGRGRA